MNYYSLFLFFLDQKHLTKKYIEYFSKNGRHYKTWLKLKHHSIYISGAFKWGEETELWSKVYIEWLSYYKNYEKEVIKIKFKILT